MSTRKKIMITLIVILLLLTAGVYGYGVYYFTEHFLPGSMVNGFNCSYMTVKESEELLTKKTEAYVLTINTRNNGQESITAEAKVENIDVVTNFVNDILEENCCPMKIQMQIDVVIDEIFGNISYYAYGADGGKASVQAGIEKGMIVLVFIDQGIPYNPLENKDPDITLNLEEREIGGLGIYMVKKIMDEVSYEYMDGQNILRMRKSLSSR